MSNREIHILDIKEGKELKGEIEEMIYESNLPSYVIIAILEHIKYEIIEDSIYGDDDDG